MSSVGLSLQQSLAFLIYDFSYLQVMASSPTPALVIVLSSFMIVQQYSYKLIFVKLVAFITCPSSSLSKQISICLRWKFNFTFYFIGEWNIKYMKYNGSNITWQKGVGSFVKNYSKFFFTSSYLIFGSTIKNAKLGFFLFFLSQSFNGSTYFYLSIYSHDFLNF